MKIEQKELEARAQAGGAQHFASLLNPAEKVGGGEGGNCLPRASSVQGGIEFRGGDSWCVEGVHRGLMTSGDR